ncbi:MAG TPA: hypothetical protein VMG08_10135 [Allosphingosinicella sp.]|nr:hypothetical protein [Allosphingosinicella sp.]
MDDIYAIVLDHQLEDEDTNYLDLLDSAETLQGLTDEPEWNPHGDYDSVLKAEFQIERLSDITIRNMTGGEDIDGARCKLEAN